MNVDGGKMQALAETYAERQAYIASVTDSDGRLTSRLSLSEYDEAIADWNEEIVFVVESILGVNHL